MRDFAVCLIIVGIGVVVIGYVERPFISHGGRPYAYISVMAAGAMMMIAGALFWKDS